MQLDWPCCAKFIGVAQTIDNWAGLLACPPEVTVTLAVPAVAPVVANVTVKLVSDPPALIETLLAPPVIETLGADPNPLPLMIIVTDVRPIPTVLGDMLLITGVTVPGELSWYESVGQGCPFRQSE
jgi:hypothetical protein